MTASLTLRVLKVFHLSPSAGCSPFAAVVAAVAIVIGPGIVIVTIVAFNYVNGKRGGGETHTHTHTDGE